MVQEDSLKKLIVVCGPTASGKTDLAIKIAERIGSEIVSADSVAIYKKLDIGTAKASAEERRRVPHRMIDVAEPTDDYSVAEYERAARAEIARLLSLGKIPIVCGGTGYYIDAILFSKTYGNCPKDQALRDELRAQFDNYGAKFLYERLRAVDALTAEKLSPNDFLRVSRALEIFLLTGKRKSDITDPAEPRFRYVAFSIDIPRETLYERINERVDKMFDRGLVAEVESLLAAGVPVSAQSMQGIGYKEIADGLLKGLGEPEMREAVKQNTRRFAKRQITYFKRLEGLRSLSPKDPFGEAVGILENERFIY